MIPLNTAHKNTRRNLAIFIAVVVASGWLGAWISRQGRFAAEENPGMLLWLVAPLIVTLLLRAFGGDGWKDTGIKPRLKGNAGWYVFSLLIFPIITMLAIGIGMMAGYISFKGFSFSFFLPLFAAGLLPNFIKNIPEEFVWRGYLAPKLGSLWVNDFTLYITVGLVWGIWHIPYYLYFLDSESINAFTSLSLPVFIPLTLLSMLVWSILFVEIFLITGSIWPAVLLHMVEDAFINPLVMDKSFVLAEGMDWLFHPVVGLVSLALFTIVGLMMRKYRRRKEWAALPGYVQFDDEDF